MAVAIVLAAVSPTSASAATPTLPPDPATTTTTTTDVVATTSTTEVATSTSTTSTTIRPTPSTTTTVRPRPPKPKDPIRDSKIVKWPGTGEVAISFDDGPQRVFTPRALAVLAQAKVPATFFVNCVRFAWAGGTDAVKSAARAGHSIQNHTWSHPYLGSTETPEAITELHSCSKAIQQLTGKRPTVFRPPYGSTSPRVRGIAKWLGMDEVMWNICPPTMTFTAARLVGSLEGQIRRKYRNHREGIVILLHDGSGSAGATVQALPEIIRFLKSLGYTFVRLG